MPHILGLLLTCFLLACAEKDGATGGAKTECKEAKDNLRKANAEVTSLRAKLDEATRQLEKAKAKPQNEETATKLSVLAALTSAYDIASEAANGLGAVAAREEIAKFTAQLSAAVELARAGWEKVPPCNHIELIEKVKSHEVYKEHLAPHVEKATLAADPAMRFATETAEPMLIKAREAYAVAHENVMPVLNKGRAMALEHIMGAPEHLNLLSAALGKMLSPIYERLAKLSPMHATRLPEHPVDRLLLIIVTLLIAWNAFKVLRFAVKLFVWVAWRLFKLALLFAIKLPFKILRVVFSLYFWFATGFYCCGLCRRKRKVEDLKDKSKNSSNGNSSVKNGAPKSASVAETTQLLEAAKKENKMQDAAKKLAAMSKSGKPLSQPKSMEGKVLAKETLKQALSKFKEVDQKKLDL